LKNGKLYFVKYINGVECRIYNELEVTPVQAFYSELEVYFNQCIEKGYNIYVLNNKPTHNIELTNSDVTYISMNSHMEEPFGYYFSENLKYIKENQYIDYKWLLCENKLDFLICIPNLDEDNKYYYNFIIGLKDKFKINNIINHKFNLIELINCQYLNQMFFNTYFLENLFKIKKIEDENTVTTNFKDSSFTSNEINLWRGKKGKNFPIQDYIKMCLVRISFHFYYDNSLKKMCAYTDFLELVNGVVAQRTENGVEFKSVPYPVPFIDLIDHNDEFLYFMSWEIEKFHWTEIDHERAHLSFQRDIIKQNTPELIINERTKNVEKEIENYKKELEEHKKKIEKFKLRLKEYRKLLKEIKKK
jgi:hypothetical protein